jgi:hypothetical protein
VSATVNPFGSMAVSLLRSATAAPKTAAQAAPLGENENRTERIRAVLREAGRPMSATEILIEAGFPCGASSGLVGALLKWDIRQRRVVYEDCRYCWNDEEAAREAAELRHAAQLLRRHGFSVSEPA